LQLKEDLTAEIGRGTYKPHQRLPSQRELCEEYGLSHMTVRRAINELIQEGIIYAEQGKGLYAAEQKQQAELGPLYGFTEDMMLRGMKASSRTLQAGIMTASTMLAHTLQVVVGAPLVHFRRLRLADDEPMALQTIYIPHALCPGLLEHDLEKGSLYEILRVEYGLHLANAESAAGADLASEEEAALLKLTIPAALLVTEQLTYLANSQPIEYARSIYRGDRYRLQIVKDNSPHKRK
ncbi:MAG: GntR family transcriptional regulator, partial [Anaerolineae bacterium]|nr:GntR family transcriptional regulator [Anaerolineae bacterium]